MRLNWKDPKLQGPKKGKAGRKFKVSIPKGDAIVTLEKYFLMHCKILRYVTMCRDDFKAER